MKSSTSKKFAELVTKFPKTVLIFVAGLLVLSSFNLSNFKLDASSDSLVLETDDDLKYYREISEDYSSSDFLIVIFEPNEDLFSQKVVSQVRSMVDSFTNIEGVKSVLSYLDAPLLFSPKMPMTELVDNLRTSFSDLIKVAPNLTEEHTGMLSNIKKPNRLVDRAISLMTLPNQEKQEILEEVNIKTRIDKAVSIINREIQRIKLGEEIQTEVHDEIAKTQREYYLREQMKAIQKELGEDEGTVELKELENRIKIVSERFKTFSGLTDNPTK